MARQLWGGAAPSVRRGAHRYRRPISRAVGVCIVFVGSIHAGGAKADLPVRIAVDWEKLGVLLQRDDAEPPSGRRSETDHYQRPSTARSLFDAATGSGRWSLIARDWNASRPIMGPSTAIDEVKTWRSRRMVLMRIKLTEGPLAPFAQIGLGEWRIDPDAPSLPHVSLTAGQIGIGLGYALASTISIVVEADCTALESGPGDTASSQTSDPLDIPHSSQRERWVRPSVLWGSLFAARLRF
jgi:hypothetical protein